MLCWELEEYLSLAPLLARVLWANHAAGTVGITKIAFGPQGKQYVLLFRPDSTAPQRKTAILFAHGGSWRFGEPVQFRFIGQFFSQLGFPTLLTGYRSAPTYRFPAQMEDVYAGLDAGLVALKHQAIPVDRMILVGQSAGAHLVSLLAYDWEGQVIRLLQQAGISLAGLLLVSGPLDFSRCTNRSIRTKIGQLMGPIGDWAQADPIGYVRGTESWPVLCVHGDRDPLIDAQNSRAFIDRLPQSERVLPQIYLVRHGHHSDLAELFLQPDHPAAQTVREWLDAVDGDPESFHD